jgi:ribosome-associated translation inhibitor RaiA
VRIEVFGNGFKVTDVLRTYIESRVWFAVGRASRELSWVGVRLMIEDDARVGCQLDVWLRGIGLVTVRHIDVNPYIGIDCAAVRVEQAIVRKLREAGRYIGPASERRISRRSGHRTARRYGVLITASDTRPRLNLIPWLRTRYGIEQLQTVSLGWPEWNALVAGELDSPHLKRIKDRLALAQLCRPEAIVIVGGTVPQASYDERPQARSEVERIVGNVQSLGLPIEVIGVWVNERWTSDECLIESEELPLPKEHGSEKEVYAGLASA